VEPTVIENPDMSSPVMEEEIFGPVIPVVYIKNIDEAIKIINSKDKPLATYYFGKVLNNPNKDKVLD
jgi:acyl-CoA reductase-like NAD-dependent aldehyde dehydrogenase